jgi:hypothetical protein
MVTCLGFELSVPEIVDGPILCFRTHKHFKFIVGIILAYVTCMRMRLSLARPTVQIAVRPGFYNSVAGTSFVFSY